MKTHEEYTTHDCAYCGKKGLDEFDVYIEPHEGYTEVLYFCEHRESDCAKRYMEKKSAENATR